jgi:hypothetical protein
MQVSVCDPTKLTDYHTFYLEPMLVLVNWTFRFVTKMLGVDSA